jgi:hypothetical protein
MNEVQTNLLKLFPRLESIIQEDEDFAEILAADIEDLLDSLASDDFFGTERQCDPRGDFRDGEWSIFGEIQ